MRGNQQTTSDHPAAEFLRSERGLAATWILVLLIFASAIIAVAIHDRRAWALPGAILVSILLAAIQLFETREQHAVNKGRAGLLVFLALVSAVTFLIYFPTLHVYFFSDDFGCLHAFHQPSLARFLSMFHTDLAQLVEGETGQEIRPFYDLFYLVNFKLWGLNPVGYHLSALLADILNSLLVFAIADKLVPGNQVRAGFAALFFSVLPLHSMAVSWIAGAPAEGFPTLFYLASFYCFVCFRTTQKQRCLWMSFLAFAACLLCKEIAVTLPLMLLSYDLFRHYDTQFAIPSDNVSIRQSPLQQLPQLLPHLSFFLLLFAYLAWRHIVFGHLLGESFWADAWNQKSHGVIPGSTGMAHEFARFLRFIVGQQVFNLHALLFMLPPISLALVLGVCLVWAIQLLQINPQNSRAIRVTLYFGVVWFCIAALPLLAAAPDPRHLYLPAVGPCIAIAFLAMPANSVLRKGAGYSRLLACALIVLVSALCLRAENITSIQAGNNSLELTSQLAAAIAAMPEKMLVIVKAPGGAVLPFALQPPFTSTDLYFRAQIIEPRENSGFPQLEWWQKNQQILETELSGAPDESIEINLLEWDDSTRALHQSSRALPRKLVQASLTQALGSNPTTIESASDEQAEDFVETLVQLASNGAAQPASNRAP